MRTEKAMNISDETEPRTKAAILDRGRVIGECETAQRNGGYVCVAWGGTSGDALVNAGHYKISRSRTNLNAAVHAERFDMVRAGEIPVFVPGQKWRSGNDYR